MTISVDKNHINLVADGVLTAFGFDFYIGELSHVVIYFDGELSGAARTVTGLDNPAGGTVTFATAPDAGVTVSIYRIVPVTQETVYRTYGRFPGPTFEADLDKSTFIDQQLEERNSRTLQLSPGTDPDVSTAIPAPEAYQYMRWDAAGENLENVSGTIDFAGAAAIESITLVDGQLIVPFINDVGTASFILNGPDCDNGRLLEATDFVTDTVANTIVLIESRPAGSIVTMAYINLETTTEDMVYGYDTLLALHSALVYANAVVYLKEDGRAGTFKWDSSDLSTEVTADTQSGIYVAPTSDATGASGAWVRQYDGQVHLDWFGVDNTGNVNVHSIVSSIIDLYAKPKGWEDTTVSKDATVVADTGTYLLTDDTLSKYISGEATLAYTSNYASYSGDMPVFKDLQRIGQFDAGNGSRPLMVDMHFGVFKGTGMITGEVGGNVIYTLSSNVSAGSLTMDISSTAKPIANQLIVYKDAVGLYKTVVVEGVAGTTVTVRAPLEAAIEAGDNVFNAYDNAAHANTYGMRAVADFALSEVSCTKLLVGEYVVSGGNVAYNNTQDYQSTPLTYPTTSARGVSYTLSTAGDYVDYTFSPSEIGSYKVKMIVYGRALVSLLTHLSGGTYTSVSSTLAVANNTVVEYEFAVTEPNAVCAIRVAFSAGVSVSMSTSPVWLYKIENPQVKNFNGGTHVLLGDSWFARLDIYNRLRETIPNATFIRRGHGGDRASNLMTRFNDDVRALGDVDFVWVMCGTNDYWNNISSEEFNWRMRQLISYIVSMGATPILFNPSVASLDGSTDDLVRHELARQYAREVTYLDSQDQIESGSNAYGSYTKYPDGTLIQWRNFKADVATSAVDTWTSATFSLPIPFKDLAYSITTNIFSPVSNQMLLSFGTTETASTLTLYAMSGYSAITVPVTYMAIGRWK